MQSASETLVECHDLGRDYGQHTAVDKVSFSLSRGEVLAFLGPNGAGKSSTMNMLTGCLAPSRGSVRIAGIDLLESPKSAKAHVGYLPEHPPLYPELTVNEYLAFTARLRGLRREKVRQAVARARARCGLEAQGKRLIGHLSRGYQQRVGIAQAIIHEPALVILDEPTVGLDPIQVREIRALIRELGQDHGVILSTHILPEVTATCSRVQIMFRGRLVYEDHMAAINRGHSRQLRLTLSYPIDPSALWELPGVESVEKLDEQDFRIQHAGREELAPMAAELAVKQGWGLKRLEPEQASLEQIFVALTGQDNAPAEGAAA
ncbi:ATP-binding cassette domain-containing protein [Natronospira bacteriovora]|uniref:ATP-binding cassette domain-containing protein n=1 Tax=Natronospira bacteriovora TaxID=3069753 RepID=A0ABU0W8Y3_9GAMM|nr:ATP-binding cassette domain-containing protein [Natronospira sp. AB-CW4]MDQ2070490.1 ATP-binding cassette domain-containing protein [Natronospira sp. AB-CW4]